MSASPLLDAILRPGALDVSFEPVFDFRRGQQPRLHAFECVVHGPAGTNGRNPDVLFDYARRKREESRVERACLAAALGEARRLPAGTPLCLRLHPSVLEEDPEFLVFLGDTAEACGIAPESLTVALLSRAGGCGESGLPDAVDALRSIGVGIAVAGIGAGACGFPLLLATRPDYLWIDPCLVRGCHADFYRQAVLEALAHLARKFGARIVAAGVEDAADLDGLSVVGIHLAQGNVLARRALRHPMGPLQPYLVCGRASAVAR